MHCSGLIKDVTADVVLPADTPGAQTESHWRVKFDAPL